MSAAPAGSGRGVGPRFPIRIHSSWLLLTAVLSALFAVIYFRADTGVSTVAAATMGVLTSALLFASVLVHELAHAVAARRQGLEVKRITLKVFGGNTELVRDPSDPASELRIALAGPVATLVLLVAFAVPGFAIDSVPAAARAVASNLALINALLLAFNLIPAIPLDGGRILRAVLWALWGKPAAATRAVTAAGRSFGFLFVAFGVLALFAGGATGEGARLVFGAGFVLIGLHLRGAAAHVARHLWIADSLHGVTADNLLDYRILTAERNATGHDLAAMGTRHADIPVVDDTRLVGAVRLADLLGRPTETWGDLTAEGLMRTDIIDRTVAPTDAATALLPLFAEGRRSIAVVDDADLVGFITLDTFRKRLSLRSGS